MKVTIQIPQVLCKYAGGQSAVIVSAGTVREALKSLERDYPALYACVCDETGCVRRHVNVFINNDFLRDRDGLQTVLGENDVLSIFQAVSGG